MSEIIGVACAAIFGISTLIGCLLLPKCRESEEPTMAENTHLINDVDNDTEEYVHIKCKPIIILKFNTKSHSNKRDDTLLVTTDSKNTPCVISQSKCNNAFKLSRLKEVSKEKDHHSSIKSQKSVSNSRYNTFQNSDSFTDHSEESRTDCDNNSSVRQTPGLRKKIALPASDSNGSLIINKELQSVSMQASLPRNNIDSLKSISNATSELVIPKSIQKNVLNAKNLYYRFNDCSDDTEYYKIPADPLLHTKDKTDKKEKPTYPSTSTKIGSKYIVKGSWRNINQVRKHINLLFAKIRRFL